MVKGSSIFGNELDEVEIVNAEETKFAGRTTAVDAETKVFLGLNGQLSTVAVPVNRGSTYRVYIGVPGDLPEPAEVFSTSKNISINGGSIVSHSFFEGIKVLSVELEISPSAELGEYSLFLRLVNGRTIAVPGSLSLEAFQVRGFRSIF